eukprot:jgi/Psemu1/182055/e_gw1.23.209.1
MNCASLQFLLALLLQNADTTVSFSVVSTPSRSFSNHRFVDTSGFHARTAVNNVVLQSSESDEPATEEEKAAAVGNLVENDEWEGLTMELSEVIKMAVIEDLKKNTRDFLGKEEYKVGDITKEIDARVKGEIASMRGNEEYQLGDLIVVMDNMAKDMTEDMTGKPYEAGDLSKELDTRVKGAVASYCGKDEYEFGDLSQAIDKRVKDRVSGYIGKDEYEFGDISRQIENQRREWVKGYLGEDAAKDYQFGDITKQALKNLSGNDDYQFGDITKKFMGNIFGGKKK